MNVRRVGGRLCITIGLGAVLLAGLAGLLFAGCGRLLDQAFDMCGNNVLRAIPSPDGRLKAVVFERDCGATSGSSTQVSVLRAGEKLPNEAGNLFVADTNHGAAPGGPGGGPMVGVGWTGRSQLLVTYDPGARVFLSQKRVSVRSGLFRTENVVVHYKTTRAPAPAPERVSHRDP